MVFRVVRMIDDFFSRSKLSVICLSVGVIISKRNNLVVVFFVKWCPCGFPFGYFIVRSKGTQIAIYTVINVDV